MVNRPDDVAMTLGAGVVQVDMPWWAILVVVLASIALTAFGQICRYRLAARALDKATSRDVERITRIVMEAMSDGRGRWWERRRNRSVATDRDRQ